MTPDPRLQPEPHLAVDTSLITFSVSVRSYGQRLLSKSLNKSDYFFLELYFVLFL